MQEPPIAPKPQIVSAAELAKESPLSLQCYVQTIARISQDKAGAYWFNAICREFDDPFKPVLLRKS